MTTPLRSIASICVLAWFPPRLAAAQVGDTFDAALGSGGVLIDATQGPTIWARGASYKAGFGREGAQFVPFLGSAAPRNYPVLLALRAIEVGGAPLGLDGAAAPRIEGNVVSYERGGVVELYRLAPDSLEQLFRIDDLSRRGEIVLRIGVETELEAFADAGGIRFHGEHGGARYGAAIAFDARGRSADAPVTWADGAIEIRVPAEFVADAAAPILVDPLVTTLAIDTSPADDRAPDVAYDASLDVYALCWQRAFSQTDKDLHGAILDGAGNLQDEFVIDVGPAVLFEPRIAGIDALDRFLVAMIDDTSTTQQASVRMVDLTGGSPSVGAPTTLPPWGIVNLKFGGDAGTTPPFRCCLVAGSSFCQDVGALVLDEDGEPAAPGIWFGDCDTVMYEEPRVSKTAGELVGGQRGWRVIFEYREFNIPTAVQGVRVMADGTWDGLTTIANDSSARSEAVSSFLDDETGQRAHVAVWRKIVAGGPDVLHARAFLESVGGPVVTLGSDATIEYVDASADSDGSNFVVTYTGRRTPGVVESIVAESLALEGLGLVLTERTVLSPSSGVDGASTLTSARSGGGGAPQRFLAAWHDLDGSDGDIEGAIYGTPGPGVRYCTSAPNSVGPGATIHASGSISIDLDQFELSAIGCPPNRPGIFYLGLSQVEVPFGEGFRCIGGATRRITPTLTTDVNGTVSLLLDFDQPYGNLVQPGSPGINYQFWYRDPAGGPSHFNLSDALHVEHTP